MGESAKIFFDLYQSGNHLFIFSFALLFFKKRNFPF